LIYVILGQTASGKTKTAISLARELHLPIISADAYQCFKMMQIGTDKPSKEEVDGLDYYFYDEYEPDKEMSVFDFQKECRPILEKYVQEGKDVLVVGGTFLYIKALLFNYVFTNDEKKTKDYSSLPLDELQRELKERSLDTYNSIDYQNPRRVIRALSQLDEGTTHNEIIAKNEDQPLYPTTFLKIDIDKEDGNKLIDERVEKMFASGFEDEVKRLLKIYPADLRAFLSIGYQEMIAGLKENQPISDIKELIKVHTHQLAKKQRTFLRNQFSNVYSGSAIEVSSLIRNSILLKERTRLILNPYALNVLESASVLQAGVGGVGGEALLGLARLGIPSFTIIDGDQVEPSNLNRQSLFFYDDIGKRKAVQAGLRLKAINPLVQVAPLDEVIKTEADLPSKRFTYIIDCIDDVNAKCLLYEKALKDHSYYLTSMGLGFHADSTKVRYGKLPLAFDPLSKAFKENLKKRGHSDQEIAKIDIVYAIDARIKGKKNDQTIGSLPTVPPSGGLALVSLILSWLLERKR